MRSENPGASSKAIQQHYDIGNEFYALWLDSTLSHSGAMWNPGDNLETALLRKIDYHIEQSGAPGAERVLDIGCGWGGRLKRLVKTYEVKKAVGLTLSPAQAAWVGALGIPDIDFGRKVGLNISPINCMTRLSQSGRLNTSLKSNHPTKKELMTTKIFYALPRLAETGRADVASNIRLRKHLQT